ncbi:MAG: FeoA family protein [Dehalococcoidia bacterium]|jgi:ferrous iron transport protein A
MTNHHLPLNMVPPGEAVKIVSVRAGRGLSQRLADMGLTPGTLLTVINSYGAGPVLINLRGTRLALGFGIAQKITVARKVD